MRRTGKGVRGMRRAPRDGLRLARPFEGISPLREMRVVRRAVAVLALLLGAYCLLSAAVALSDTSPDNPNPAELAARERYQWPGLIPIIFLTLVVGYAVFVAARRRQTRILNHPPSPPSTQDPPPLPSSTRDRPRTHRS